MNAQLMFIGKKLIRLILLLIVVSIAAFTLVEMSPVDSVQAYIGPNAMKLSSEKRAEIEEYWGLNEPITTRFVKWSRAIIKGDFGESLIYKRPVLDIIGEKFSASIILMMIAWTFSGVLGYILALLSGSRQGGILDKGIKAYCYLLLSTPTFWLCLLLIVVFSVSLGWFPVALSTPIGVLSSEVTIWDLAHHMILPAITLGTNNTAIIARMTRSSMLEVIRQDYIRTARSKGVNSTTIIMKHALRNASIPVVTVIGLQIGALLGGAVLTETVFSLPGLGTLMVNAIRSKDTPMVLGSIIVFTVLFSIVNLIVDILYAFLDPRIKAEYK